jgi:PIN domain nuclease of toxin-antitoxin system
MSEVLLDSHVVLWLLADNKRLGRQTRGHIERSAAVYVSAASTWELNLKSALGKLELPAGFGDALTASGLKDLPVTRAHTLDSDLLSLPHRDPFDAILIAQARAEGLTFITADAKILDAWDEAVDAAS